MEVSLGSRMVDASTVRAMSEPTKPEQGTWQQGMGLPIGLALGAALGLLVFDNIGLGMAMGVAIGLVIDAIARRQRQRQEPEGGDPDSPEQ
jgi:predicted MFS family arabinose efflux permease